MIWETFKLAFQALLRNALRSSLTVLGIVIGVAAVIAMVTIGNGTTAQVTADISKLGTNLLTLRPGQGPGRPGGARATAPPFDMDDVEAIERQIGGVRAVAPVASAGATAIFANTNWNTSVTGSTNDYFLARQWSFAEGRRFLENEVRAGVSVCIIGETVRRELFGGSDPVAERIRLKNVSCEVVGLLAAKGQAGFGGDQDDTIIMPIRAVQRRFLGNQDVRSIFVSAAEGVSTDRVRRDLTALMRERRRISTGEEDDFHIFDMTEIT
ncbi:MAG TPA: ABC transporter permease, partial [Hyphomicrobiales bacterium]|nr:ABC transporter permease [Hyphomicrobiales bacterium]